MDVAEIGRSYAAEWGTLALIINAGLAQAKGRSRLAWFLVSLLGPIATFLIVITDNAKPPAAGSAGWPGASPLVLAAQERRYVER